MKRSRIVVVALSLCLALALTILGLAFVNSDGRRDESSATSPSRPQSATKIDASDSELKGDPETSELRALPLLASGRVTGIHPRWNDLSQFTVGSVHPGGDFLPFSHHATSAEITVTTTESGSFEVRGRVPKKLAGMPLALRVRNTSRHSDPVPFDPGQRDLTLHVLEPGTVKGRVLLPQGMDPRAIHIVCESIAPSSDVLTASQSLRAEGSFIFRLLRPGRGRFRAVLHDRSQFETEFQIESAEIISGETIQLPELDLRNRLHRYETSLTFPNDETPAWSLVSVVPDIAAELLGPHAKRQRHHWLHYDTTPELTFLAQASGCRHVYFTVRPGRTVIEMKPKIPVTLEVVPHTDGLLSDLSTIKAVENLQLVLVLRDPGLDRSFDREFDLCLNPAVTVHRAELERPGTMALRLELRQLTPKVTSEKFRPLHSVDLGRIEVRDEEDQQYRIAVSASKQDALRQVLADYLD
jgi:hypothetical protein